MSELTYSAALPRVRRSWSGSAFILEALVLLLCIAASLAVLITLFSQAYLRNGESAQMTEAIALASNAAESFAASPQDSVAVAPDGRYVAFCTVEAQPVDAGVIYHGSIAVYSTEDEAVAPLISADALEGAHGMPQGVEPIYALETSNYVSGVDR